MINFHREGSGPPLVLLHGVGLSWQIWRPVIVLLRDRFDVIACDSPGFGDSPPLPEAVVPAIPAYADAFAAFFAELGIERPHVSGNSMGGAIGLELARRGAVASVSALSPAGFWTQGERRFCQVSLQALADIPSIARPAVLAAAGTRIGRVAMYWQTFGRPTRMPAEEGARILQAAWAAPAFESALAAFSDYTFSDGHELSSSIPVTVAWGIQDRLLPYSAQSQRARALLPRARHLSLGVGHVPFFDDPPVVAETIRSSTRSSVV